MSENYQKIRIEQDGEIIHTTVGLYKFFMSNGSDGMDAYMLYSHLQFTARLQETNSVKANDVYLKKGLSWGNAKLKKAKSFLKKAGLIGYKQERLESGQYGDRYIELKTRRSPVGQFTDQRLTEPPVDRTTGDERQMLKEKSKCLNKQVNALNPPKSKPKPKIDQVFIDIAEQLFFDIQKYVEPPMYKARNPDLMKWAIEIEKIHRIDKQAINDIKIVAAWVVRHSFWSTNVLSGFKLRKHFNTLFLQMKNKSSGKQEMDLEETLNTWNEIEKKVIAEEEHKQ